MNERLRIARELHDTLLQSLQGLLLRFQAASNLLPIRPEEARQKLDKAIDMAAEAITEGRGAVQGLRVNNRHQRTGGRRQCPGKRTGVKSGGPEFPRLLCGRGR